MSIILKQEVVQGSYISENKLILEPIIDPNQTLPFLESQILKPDLFKAGILQLNQILMAHPGISLNRIYDPVVTVTENYVDFEGFSRFGHSYCKIRFPETLFKERIRQEGMTNVDFNPQFIRDLRSRSYTPSLWLYIDPDGIELAIDKKAHILKKIVMPKWWKDAYQELKYYVNIETMEPHISEEYNKVILSGKSFQQLVRKVENSYLFKHHGVRSLFWDDKSVNLLFGGRKEESVASIKLIEPCNKPARQWGVWRIQNLSEIADQIIQADVYLANKLPSFWILYARSGIQLLLGYTPYTSALWTETARKDIENLLKDPYRDYIEPRRQRRRKKRYKRRIKPKSRINFVQMHPGQRVIPDFFSN
ncbi:MAG: hypothetical protein HWN66_12390 [Candidatus Helarchaeota archaeon]|nr:hypothetical protein [Candidatus Helarchaeota archaeon]